MRLNYLYWLVHAVALAPDYIVYICIVPIPRIIGGGAVGHCLVLSVTPYHTRIARKGGNGHNTYIHVDYSLELILSSLSLCIMVEVY